MLPKAQRLDRTTVSALFKSGHSLNSSNFVLKFSLAGKGAPKISFIVPKSVAKNPTARNSLRRRGYAIAERYLSGLPIGFSGIFIFKKNQREIENEIKS